MLKDFTRKEFRGMAAAYLATPELRQKLREAVQVRADHERRSHSHVLAHMQNHLLTSTIMVTRRLYTHPQTTPVGGILRRPNQTCCWV